MTIGDCLAEGGQFLFGTLGVVAFLIWSVLRWCWRWLGGLFGITRPVDLSKEVVVITGAGTGLGQAIALQLAQRNCRLVLLARVVGDLAVTVEQLHALGTRDVLTYECDARDRGSINAAASRIICDVEGRITALVNNAGVAYTGCVEDLSPSAIEDTVDVNLMSQFWLIRALLPTLRKQERGHIVCIASIAGLFGASDMSAYCASKFGVVGMCESLAMEFHKQRSSVRLTCVCPYQINTKMFAGVRTRFQWLLPVLDVEYVAQRVVGSLFSDRHLIYLPRSMYLLPVIKTIAPHCFMLRVADFLGITTAAESASRSKTE